MQRYLGLDVHADSCTLSVLSEAGKGVRRDVVETNGQALVSLLKQIPGTLHLCVEEGEWSQWLYEILSPHVAQMVVVWAEGKRGAKSDAIDARGLAERLRTGRLGRVVYKAARKYGRLRELARVYELLTRDVARTKSRIKSLFRRRGVPCSGDAIYHAEVREKRLATQESRQWIKNLDTTRKGNPEPGGTSCQRMSGSSSSFPTIAESGFGCRTHLCMPLHMSSSRTRSLLETRLLFRARFAGW
jgi:hypothetical protein